MCVYVMYSPPRRRRRAATHMEEENRFKVLDHARRLPSFNAALPLPLSLSVRAQLYEIIDKDTMYGEDLTVSFTSG